MAKIARIYSFEAAHFLPHVPREHKCSRMHGHSYQVRVTLEGTINEKGWVLDFYDLDTVVNVLVGSLDHRCLNDLPGLDNPTAENIAMWFKNGLSKHFAPDPVTVRVYETRDSYAEV